MATTAYVSGAQMQWRRGLSLKIRDAPLFYGALGTAAVLGTVVALSGISPIRLLFIAGIIGGIATPIGLILLLAVGANRTLMGDRPVTRRLLVAGWTVTAVITVLSLAFVLQQLSPGP
jgi:Mn2+/Fe2+ NRAMP family transporter